MPIQSSQFGGGNGGDGNGKDPPRLSSGGFQKQDAEEFSLRPQRLAEYIGQPKIKEMLGIMLAAAKMRSEPLDHLLLHGPPGLGKTSLANVIAREMGAGMRATSGPAIEKPGDLVAILTNLEEGSVLFIDEIHRLNRVAEEFLYPAMEDYKMDIVLGSGASARTVTVPLPHFTLIGATTRPGLLSNPLRDRFGITHYFEFYDATDLTRIIVRSAELLSVGIDTEGAMTLASRSRGTPRIANRILKRARDYAQVRGDGHIDRDTANAALEMQGVDGLGLDDFDRKFLRTLIEKFEGGPTGVETLAATLQEERDTIEDVYEPYLLLLGFLNRTPRGRIATRGAYEHLGIPYRPSKSDDPSLF